MSARTFSFFILKLMLRRIKNDIYRIQSSNFSLLNRQRERNGCFVS